VIRAARTLGVAVLVSLLVVPASDAAAPHAIADAGDANGFLRDYCENCHNDWDLKGNWSLDMVSAREIARGENLAAWENIFRMIRDGAMPPPDKDQPPSAEREAFTAWLQAGLDGYAARHPNPGQARLRRLNRAEYANAVRDLLALDVDLDEQLPGDDAGYGFDNIADLLSVSSTLLDRYFAVAGAASRLAVGAVPATAVLTSYQVPKDGSILNQGIPSWNERRSDDLPLDSRGGGAFAFYAPHDGTYEISGYLNANTNNEVDRLEANRYALEVSLPAGPHRLGMSFRKRLGLDESVQTLRNTTDIVPLPAAPPEDLALDFVVDGARVGTVMVPSYHLSPRFAQHNFPRDVLQIDVAGPLRAHGPGDTPSRRRVLICRPAEPAPDAALPTAAERRCAGRILTALTRRAYRRPVDEADIEPLLQVFADARGDAGFERAIAASLQALLVSPQFLFLVERDPVDAPPGTAHRISDLEFASRLALFLWSSLPDDELLRIAEGDRLRRPPVLRAQLQRMLADPRAAALTENFAGQWLYLRNLDFHRPDVMAFPDFDVRLREALRQETERFFAALVRDDDSVLALLDSDHSYLNERLAKHYGIDGVLGTPLRRVTLPAESPRGGVLGQGSLLTLTSYGNHTSVVRRGQWILDSLLAAPQPPPPPDVPALVAERDGEALNAREQLALHRADPVCASCHVKMDPLGLALERFDAVGAYRELDAGRPIDVRATLPDGSRLEGLAGLKAYLLTQRDQFTRALTEQLLTYALGRGIEAYDRPTIRAIAASTAEQDYRMHALLEAIVTSYPFNHRRTPSS